MIINPIIHVGKVECCLKKTPVHVRLHAKLPRLSPADSIKTIYL